MFRLDRSSLPPGPVTRFAPSPTGLLHLGHVANAVWTWGIAGATGGRVLLRIEDHDRGRCRPEFEHRILEDLAWLGLIPDSVARDPGGVPWFARQSDRDEVYREALARLGAKRQVYGCACSRRAIAAAHGHSRPPAGDELPYPGTCRGRNLAPGPGLGIRVVLPEGPIEFTDGRHGRMVQHPTEQCGDLLLRDRHGNWTYQFGVVVDDFDQGVDLVVRGDDLLESTGRQILLGGMLGRPAPPAFIHHPLILAGSSGAKLSKRDQAEGIGALRDAGRTGAQVLGEAAHRTGLLPAPRELDPAELAGLFG